MKNKGITLLEVIVAVAILGTIMVVITRFMNTGIKTSSRANAESNLQKEAQTGLNQVTDWVMSSNHGIAVYGSCVYYDEAVVLYHNGKTAPEQYVQILYYRKADNKVYYDKKLIGASFHGAEGEIQNAAAVIAAGDEWNKYLFCEYVKDFHMDITNIEDRYVDLTLVLTLNGIVFNQQPKRISLRNPVVTDPTVY